MGVVDNTGFSTGPHTHVMARRMDLNGNLIDENDADNSFALMPYWDGFFAVLGDRNSTVANRTDRPAVTTPATTTGSGAANRTPDSTGTKPGIPGQVPAPASTPATNR